MSAPRWEVIDRGEGRRGRYAVRPLGQPLAASLFEDREEAQAFQRRMERPMRSTPADPIRGRME